MTVKLGETDARASEVERIGRPHKVSAIFAASSEGEYGRNVEKVFRFNQVEQFRNWLLEEAELYVGSQFTVSYEGCVGTMISDALHRRWNV